MDEDGSHRAELGVHRHIVDEEVGEAHEVASPRQEDRQDGGSQQRPFHGTLHDEQAEHEEHKHKGAHVNRSAGHGLVAPILADALVSLHVVGVGFLHGLSVGGHGHTGSALGVGHEQRPCLAQAIAPLRNIVAVETAIGLVGRVFLHQLALATHALLGVLPGVVKVREVDADTDGGSGHGHARRLPEACHLVVADGVDQPSDDHEEDGEQVIVGHLHVVGLHLKRREEGGDDEAPQVFAAIGQRQTADHRRQVGQCHHLPDVSGGNDDEEIARECPHDGSQGGQMLLEIEGPQHDVEAQEIGEEVPHVVGQPQVVEVHHLVEQVGAVVRGRRLVGGHATEGGVGPAGALACALVILTGLLSGSTSGRVVVLVEDAPVEVGWRKVGERNDCEKHDNKNVG